ncbi:GTPase Era [Metamycoplasma buccale]|uniref:GTPase Era n=1 Tax=Metamycoplasma buccale TaxID=55602 RepID=UPI00398F29BB
MKKICIVGLIGRPNVGKSTLMNNILNCNLSIVSNIPQTTRDEIKGIYNDEEYQIIFIDTPGIHKSRNLLSEKLNEKSYSILKNIDLLLFLSPANEEIGSGDKFIIKKIQENNVENKIAIITKIDLINENELLNNKADQLKSYGFQTILGIGKDLKNTYKDLLDEIKKYAYESEPLYSEDQFTDVSMRFIAKEEIREAALEHLYEELPHSIAVQIDSFIEQEDTKPYLIDATIYVKKESQKGILIGKNASMIKLISTKARKKMEDFFEHRVYLKINVKVNENWVDNENKIKNMGY